MRRINARDWMNLSAEEIWNFGDERFIMIFDDGELETTTRRSIFSWYHWEAHRTYPKTPLRICHHMGSKPLSSDTACNILSAVARDIHETYGWTINRETVWKIFYEISNKTYNVFTEELEEYHTSSNILDYLEIFDHPSIQEANAAVRPTQNSLDDTYEKISEVMYHCQELSHNPVVRAVRSGLVKIDQVNQIVGPRGFMTDVDSNIFRKPITVGYLQGLTSLYDSMIESRSAVKALTFTKKPLRQVEYFNRKMQLSASNLRDLILQKDCGSDEYITAHVTKNLLKGIEGKYYLKEGKLVAARREDTHLIGKTIMWRTPTKCRLRGEGACCETCMGEIAYSVPDHTNLGHVSSTEMCQEGSQLVMSVKHYDGSSKVAEMDIPENDAKFIRESTEAGRVMLNHNLANKKAYLVMESTSKPPAEGAAGLATLTKDTDISLLSPHRITSFRDVLFGYESQNPETGEAMVLEEYVSVSLGSRLGSLSKEFLQYVVDRGYTITDSGDYRVELDQWDFGQVAFELPLRHLNMLDYMSEIEVFLRSPTDASRDSRIGGSKKLIDYTSIDEALLDLYELASSKLSVNIVHLENLLVSMMRSARDPNDYRIPPFGEPVMFERHSKLMEMRSMGSGFAYERQPAMIEDVDSYLITNRPPHILDPMLI